MIIRLLKSIDLYGKIPKGLSEPTDSGAIMSVATIVLLVLLLFNELIVSAAFENLRRSTSPWT